MIHNRLNLYRTERGLSRKELAERVDVNPQTIGFLERGDYNPSVELALRLARVFEVPVEALFSLDPFPSLSSQLAPVAVRTPATGAPAVPTPITLGILPAPAAI
ncbi:MAG: helix-turn-helix transcriptional regulator [Verrucomicrobia bacterium]|nr:helix-turn-helix transcriptional regulator [Verrucomicrobiota bacterium]